MSDIQFQELKEESQADSDSPGGVKRPQEFPEDVPERTVERSEGTPLRERVAKEREQGLKNIIIGFTVLAAGVTVAMVIQVIAGDPQLTPHGGVTSCTSICSEMGIKVLKEGGNAVDAAITTELCVGVVRPQFAGIGGGGLMLIHNHISQESTLLDFREEAPRNMPIEVKTEDYRRTGKSVGVPGEIKGLWEAHQRLGRTGWKQLLKPVIELARNGFPNAEENAVDLQRRDKDVSYQATKFQAYSDRFLAIFSRQDDIVKRPKLAQVLEKIAEEGPEAIYKGDLGREIVKAVADTEGVMTLEDLENYEVKERTPISTSVTGHTVMTFPVPSAGSVMLRMLNDMNNTDAFRKSKLGSPEYFVELAKILNGAYPCKNLLGEEPDMEDIEGRLLNPDLETSAVCAQKTVEESKGTSHINVIDNEELMVSLTTSMNWWYGSLIVTESGILLNNQLDDFSLDPQSPNALGPGKRPLTNMVPTLVFNEERPCMSRMVFGGVNGSMIFTGVAQSLGNFLFFDGSLKKAVQVPRLWCDGKGSCLLNGGQLNSAEIASRISKEAGLNVELVDWNISAVGGVMKRNNTMVAVTDDYNDWTGMTY